MTAAVTVLERAISIPGVQLTKTGLLIDPAAAKDSVGVVGQFLQVVESCNHWWWGDYLPIMVRLNLEGRPKPKSARRAEQLEMRCIAEFAAITRCSTATELHERSKVAQFFPPEYRCAELTYDHHVEAWIGANGDRSRASDWLKLAVQNAWKVSQLRAHIRREISADTEDESETKPADVDADLSNLDLLASRRLRHVRGYTPEQAAQDLAAMAHVVNLIDELRRRAARVEGAVSGPPGTA